MLRIFERKILRRIFGPVKKSGGTWKILMNRELENLIKGADIVRFIKGQRIAWYGHVLRMENDGIPKKVIAWKPVGRRLKGRPRLRWIDDVEDDLRAMNIRRWRILVDDRKEWKSIVGKAKTHPGL